MKPDMKDFNRAALSLASVLSIGYTADAKRPLNILLIISDDQSAIHLGCYGNKDIDTPNIDQFAKDAMVFERAYVTSPQSAPSRKSILTGKSTVSLQATRFQAPLDKSEITFPELLAAQKNYFTGLAGRIHHLDGLGTGPIMAFLDSLGLNTAESRFDFCKSVGEESGNRRAGTSQLEQWKTFMEQVPQNRPFFAQLCFSDPHRPYTAPKHHNPETLTLPPSYPDTPLVRADLAAYYDEIYRLDQNVGEALNYLKEKGLYDNTLIIFLGDNGAAQFMGKGTLYETGIKVPMIIRHPGLGRGERYSGIVSTEDIAPTCLEMAGIDIPSDITGESLMKVLDGGIRENKYVFAQRGSHANGKPSEKDALFNLQRTIVSQRYKLIYNCIPTLKHSPVDFGYQPMYNEIVEMNENGTLSELHHRLYFYDKKPLLELYDLETDPYEFQNLIDSKDYTEIRDNLIYKLACWMILNRDYLPTPDFSFIDNKPAFKTTK
ncbi:MAG: sulfatase [Candidatus Cryptobacteroides sp.]